MKPFIREYREDDRVSLRSIAEASVADEDVRAHTHFGPTETVPAYANTLVAEQDGCCIGFASVFQNEFHYHPLDFRFCVVVHPMYRRRGVGVTLYHALLTSTLPGKPKRLRCLTCENDDVAEQFLKGLGYRVLLTCYTPVLKVAAVNLAKLTGYLCKLEHAGYRIVTLAELVSDDKRDERITALCLEAYADTHTFSPPTAPVAVWQEEFLGEDCLEEAFFVAVQDGRYTAFSSLRPSTTNSVMEAMWDGVSRAERALEFPLRLALKAREVAYARNQGVQELHWEVDSTDLTGMHLLNVLPFERGSGSHVWVNEL